MRKVSIFESITVNGFFADANNDMSWAHTQSAKPDPEWNAFVAGNAGSGGTLLFGRITYDMMVSYWPTPQAKKNDPETAKGMNELPKVVFSRTLDTASWSNTKLVKDDPASAVRRMKEEPGSDMVVLGSGTIVSQLAQAGLIDEYRLVVTPTFFGEGRTLFEGVTRKLNLKMTASRAFANGRVLLTYVEQR